MLYKKADQIFRPKEFLTREISQLNYWHYLLLRKSTEKVKEIERKMNQSILKSSKLILEFIGENILNKEDS